MPEAAKIAYEKAATGQERSSSYPHEGSIPEMDPCHCRNVPVLCSIVRDLEPCHGFSVF